MQKLRFTSVLLIIVLLIGAYSIASGQRRNYFVYKDSLDEAAAVVDGNELTLSDLAFYIVYEENLVEKDAFIYDPENLGRYWSLHANGTYTRTEAKAAAIQMAIHDEIFYQLSQKEGIELNEAEEQYLDNTKWDFWSDLDEEALNQLGVSEGVLNESIRKIALAQKYQYLLAEMHEAGPEEYAVSGEGYQELLKEHSYEIIEKVWERVHFGSITVEH